MLAMLAYALILGALTILLVAAVGALREGIRQRGRLRGVLVSVAAMVLALAGWVVMLI